jgi:diguanylate cyclase (GGDEF)-like protein/PAS domain S-box-containing protein
MREREKMRHTRVRRRVRQVAFAATAVLCLSGGLVCAEAAGTTVAQVAPARVSPHRQQARPLVVLAGLLLTVAALGHRALSREGHSDPTPTPPLEPTAGEDREQYRTLVEHCPVPLVVLGPEGSALHYLNPAARILLQLNQGQTMGRRLDEFFRDPETGDRFLGILKSPEPLRAFDAPMVREDGTEFWASLRTRGCTLDGRPAVILTLCDITCRKQCERRLRKAADHDMLTGLPNRRHFYDLMDAEQQRAKRSGHATCAMMVDLDRFKQINDSFGHQTGDRYLQRFADICREALRVSDAVGRVGGEEFAVFLPETDLEEAERIAHRLCRRVRALSIGRDGETIATTVSIGLVRLGQEEDVHSAMGRADRAMYEAKAAGRNCVQVG